MRVSAHTDFDDLDGFGAQRRIICPVTSPGREPNAKADRTRPGEPDSTKSEAAGSGAASCYIFFAWVLA